MEQGYLQSTKNTQKVSLAPKLLEYYSDLYIYKINGIPEAITWREIFDLVQTLMTQMTGHSTTKFPPQKRMMGNRMPFINFKYSPILF